MVSYYKVDEESETSSKTESKSTSGFFGGMSFYDFTIVSACLLIIVGTMFFCGNMGNDVWGIRKGPTFG